MDPGIRYYFYDRNRPIGPDDPAWDSVLPSDRRADSYPSPATGGFTRGALLDAVHQCLARDDFSLLTASVSAQLGRQVSANALSSIDIILEKHGPFYHPLRLTVHLPDQQVHLVANVALSQAGQRIIQNEFKLMQELPALAGSACLPRVYRMAELKLGQRTRPMFLGQWLQGFHEFHWSTDPQTGQDRIRLWRTGDVACFLTPSQTAAAFRQMAAILTHFYDLKTYAQVFPWHHAGGDFVLKLNAEKVQVRLITVRGYTPLTEGPKGDVIAILESLLRFVLHLTLRTRLDRRDGTGELIWANDAVVAATFQGVLDALIQKPVPSVLPVPPHEALLYYAGRLESLELEQRCRDVAAVYPLHSAEREMISRHLKPHCRTLYHCLQTATTT